METIRFPFDRETLLARRPDLRQIPKVDEVARHPELAVLRSRLGERTLVGAVRRTVSSIRAEIQNRELEATDRAETLQLVVAKVQASLVAHASSQLRPVINATGVVLHTNLGRAPLGPEVARAIASLVEGYSNLEWGAELGERARRGAPLESRLADLVGAEAALVVNNNAAAVLLALAAIGEGKQVLVSRGELVEIGGGFRIPEVLARSGSVLKEVGTTNRTRVGDYERCFGPEVGCVLRVHPSNFKISGFTERPSLKVLCGAARRAGYPVIKDLGGGLVLESGGPLTDGWAQEATVQSCLKAGASLVCFSLDKLFGGPQGGAIVGSRTLVDRLREDPLARALRVDKMTLAALEPTVAAYAAGQPQRILLHRMLSCTCDELRQRAERLRQQLSASPAQLAVVETVGAVGGGTLAEEALESVALCVKGPKPDRLAHLLRVGSVPVVARVSTDSVLLDVRTVLPAQDEALLISLSDALARWCAERA